MRDKLLAQDRIEAIQEEIAGFLLDQVINPKGEYYYPLPPPIDQVMNHFQLSSCSEGTN